MKALVAVFLLATVAAIGLTGLAVNRGCAAPAGKTWRADAGPLIGRAGLHPYRGAGAPGGQASPH